MTQVSTDALESMGLATYQQNSGASKDTLGQEDFLRLMTTQLTNQNPMEPMENGDFLSQMAQFSTVAGIESLTDSFNTLSASLTQGQALQAAALVGRDVLVPSQTGHLEADGTLGGAVDLSAASSGVKIGVYDAGGQLVRTLDLGALGSGLQEFEWDGRLEDGSPAPEGVYEFRATAADSSGTQAIGTLVKSRVESVSIDQNGGLQLSVRGLGAIAFSDVRRIL